MAGNKNGVSYEHFQKDEQRIKSLLLDGFGVDTIFSVVSRFPYNIASIKDDYLREEASRKCGLENVPFYLPSEERRLTLLISRIQTDLAEEQKRIRLYKQLYNNDSSALHVKDISLQNIERFSSGVPGLDFVLGGRGGSVGLPVGGMVLFGAEKGCGKTRLCVEISKHIGKSPDGSGVLYIQNEESLSSFKSRYGKQWSDNLNIWLSSSFRTAAEHAKIINKLNNQIKLVIIDSISELARKSSVLEESIKIYKELSEEKKICILALSHVTKTGSIKGSSYLPHKVDVVLNAKKDQESGYFYVYCDNKNRFGPSDFVSWFQHTDDGILSLNKYGKIDPHGNISPIEFR